MPTNIHYPGEILEQTDIGLEWLDLQRLTRHVRVERTRSKGTHLSGVIKQVAIRRGLLKDEDQVDDMPMVVLLGIAWEDMAVQLYPALTWQPGECKLDGITGSPDGQVPLDALITLEPDPLPTHITGMCIEEFKLTYKSNRNRQDIRAEQMWMMQIMGYLKMKGWTIARLHVLWACDNYIMPFRPRYIRYLIRFTQQELDRNWELMLKYKQFAIRES